MSPPSRTATITLAASSTSRPTSARTPQPARRAPRVIIGLRETLALAKARGYLLYSVNAALLRDPYSIFQNLRQRGVELLAAKRREYFSSIADVDHHGSGTSGSPKNLNVLDQLTDEPVGEQLDASDEILSQLYTEVSCDGLLENHFEALPKLHKARIIEAMIGELDHILRSGDDVRGERVKASSSAGAHAAAADENIILPLNLMNSGFQFVPKTTTHPALPYSDEKLMHYLLSELVKTVLRMELGRQIMRAEAAGSGSGTSKHGGCNNLSSSLRSIVLSSSKGSSGFNPAVRNKSADFYNKMLDSTLRSNKITSTTRGGGGGPPASRVQHQQLRVDLELYEYLQKGSVWEMFRRLHFLKHVQIFNTLRKALPRLSRIRQIAFSHLLHALCDVEALTTYREECSRSGGQHERALPESAVGAVYRSAMGIEDVEGEVDNKENILINKEKTLNLKTQAGEIARSLAKLRPTMVTPATASLKNPALTVQPAVKNVFLTTSEVHQELVNCVANCFLDVGKDLGGWYCGNAKQLVDFRKSAFLTKKQKGLLISRLRVDPDGDEADFGLSRFLHLEEWCPPGPGADISVAPMPAARVGTGARPRNMSLPSSKSPTLHHSNAVRQAAMRSSGGGFGLKSNGTSSGFGKDIESYPRGSDSLPGKKKIAVGAAETSSPTEPPVLRVPPQTTFSSVGEAAEELHRIMPANRDPLRLLSNEEDTVSAFQNAVLRFQNMANVAP